MFLKPAEIILPVAVIADTAFHCQRVVPSFETNFLISPTILLLPLPIAATMILVRADLLPEKLQPVAAVLLLLSWQLHSVRSPLIIAKRNEPPLLHLLPPATAAFFL